MTALRIATRKTEEADHGLDQRRIRGQPRQDFARAGDLEETPA